MPLKTMPKIMSDCQKLDFINSARARRSARTKLPSKIGTSPANGIEIFDSDEEDSTHAKSDINEIADVV